MESSEERDRLLLSRVPPEYRDGIPRMLLIQRVQHLLLMVTFIILCLTGLSLRFGHYSWSSRLYETLGGPTVAPVLHKVAGSLMVLLFLFHTGTIIYTMVKRRLPFWRFEIFPGWKDFRDLFQHLKYLLFLSSEKPSYGRYNWKEKFDYFAVYWGIPVFGITGPILWFPEFFTRFLPPLVVNIAVIAHSDEALLAISVIAIWHLWNVHFRPLSFPGQWTFIHGKIKPELLLEDHREEFLRILGEAEVREGGEGGGP